MVILIATLFLEDTRETCSITHFDVLLHKMKNLLVNTLFFFIKNLSYFIQNKI